MLINFDGFDYGGPLNLDLNDGRNRIIFLVNILWFT
jgi:hypothetical protein